MMPTASTTHRPLVLPAWFFDLALGIISIAFGLGLLLWRSQTLAVVVWVLASYILLDSAFDIIFTFRDRQEHGVQEANSDPGNAPGIYRGSFHRLTHPRLIASASE